MKQLQIDRYTCPLGEIVLVADQNKLCFVDFADNENRMQKLLAARYGEFSFESKPNLLKLRRRFARYFGGDMHAFSAAEFNIGNLLTFGTEFQRTVWQNLSTIPTGQTISYQQLSVKIGRPNAVRAVASANANNPIAIIIPCHRVIGKNGNLRGYAGGIDRKKWLIDHETIGQNKPSDIRLNISPAIKSHLNWCRGEDLNLHGVAPTGT